MPSRREPKQRASCSGQSSVPCSCQHTLWEHRNGGSCAGPTSRHKEASSRSPDSTIVAWTKGLCPFRGSQSCCWRNDAEQNSSACVECRRKLLRYSYRKASAGRIFDAACEGYSVASSEIPIETAPTITPS